MPMIEGIPKLDGRLVLQIKHPKLDWWMDFDECWTVTKIDETHYQISPSFKVEYGRDDVDDFHTTIPFIIEIGEVLLTRKRQ